MKSPESARRRKRGAPDLSEEDWLRVYKLRCRNKRGETLSQEESALCEAAYKADSNRYAAMNDPILVATAPFGSIQQMTGKVR